MYSIPTSSPYHLTYIWLDVDYNLRQKVRIMPNPKQHTHLSIETHDGLKPELFPVWNFDGSSTGQAVREDSEVLLVPARVYISPFNNGFSYVRLLVLCECYLPDMTPHPTNHRPSAKNIFEKVIFNESETAEVVYDPYYGIEQEFFILNDNGLPVEYNPDDKQGRFYCSVDSPLNELMEKITTYSHNMNLNTVGYNTEVAPGQAEFQLLSGGLQACDDLIMLRYIIVTVAKMKGYDISFHPKPLSGDWNGSGAHVNYSTRFMRDDYGKYKTVTPYENIMHAIAQFEQNHHKHIAVYGKDNELRLTGAHETSDINTFSYGIADRGSSIRIPRKTHEDKKGYIEDRRPSSNFNPYLVLPLIFDTSINELYVSC